MPVLFLWGVASGSVFAAIGDSKKTIESQYGPPCFIQDDTKRIWNRQDWQTAGHGRAVAYGYWDDNGWQSTHWIEYDEQERAVKETVLCNMEFRIRDFQQYFNKLYTDIVADNSAVFASRGFAGERLEAIIHTATGGLNRIRFFMVPDNTRINMHSKMRGFEITDISEQTVRKHILDQTWRRMDNYFKDRLYFSEGLVPRATTDMLVIHHTALDDMSVADIHELHLTKGWAGIAYHKIILADGSIKEGRPEQMIGAHALGANPHSIGIVVDGDFENKLPTDEQMNSLVKLVQELMIKYHIPLDRVVPHRDVTEGTDCPGKMFPWKELMQRLQSGKPVLVADKRRM